MQTKSIYTKKLGREVARNAKGLVKSKLHIVSSQQGKWSVVVKGTVRPMRSFTSQKAAVAFAMKYGSSKSFTSVIVHGKDGSVINRYSLERNN